MNYVKEVGRVTDIEGEEAKIRVHREMPSFCKKCSAACSGAGSGPPIITVERDDLSVGDRVELKIARINPYLSMTLLFGLPILLFVIGSLVWGVLVGVIGLVIAVTFAWFVDTVIRRKMSPRVSLKMAEQRDAE